MVLADDEDIIDKIAYVAVNPVAEGLVSRPEEWPGLSLWTEGTMTVAKPLAYFRERGECPDSVSLRVVPPQWTHARAPVARIRAAIAYKVMQAHRKVRMAGRGFVGRAAVLTGSFIKRAVSLEPKRVVVPTVAAKNPQARKTLLAIQKAFRAAYRRALEAWKAGVRDIVFPLGTWWMGVHHGAACASESDTG